MSRIDGYVADINFRKRDPRFAAYDRFKDRYRRELNRGRSGKRLFAPADFVFADDFSHCLCPAGKKLYRNGGNAKIKNYKAAIKFKGAKSSCISYSCAKNVSVILKEPRSARWPTLRARPPVGCKLHR